MKRRVERFADIRSKTDMHYLITHAAEILAAEPEPFVVHPEISQPEQTFFAWLNERINKDVKDYVAQMAPLIAAMGTSEASQTVMGRMMHAESLNLILQYACLVSFTEQVLRVAAASELADDLKTQVHTEIKRNLDVEKDNSGSVSLPVAMRTGGSNVTNGDIQRMSTETTNLKSFSSVHTLKEKMTEPALSPPTQALLEPALEANKEIYNLFDGVRERFEAALILKRAAGNVFDHTQPIFTSDEEAAVFKRFIPLSFSTLLINKKEVKLPLPIIEEAISNMVDRVYAYDKALIIAETKRVAEQQKKETAQQERAATKKLATDTALRERQALEALRRTDEARRAHDEFMRVPRAYELERIAQSLLEHVSDYSAHTALNAYKAAAAAEIIRTVAHTLDRREEGIVPLGNHLLSAANIKAVAHAYEADNSIQHINVSSGMNLQQRAELLRKLYTTSPGAQRVVERILANPECIMVLATLTRSERRCRDYAQFLLDNMCSRQRWEDGVTKLERQFSAEEIAEFPDDLEIKKLLEAREKLAGKRNEMREIHQALVAEIDSILTGKNAKKVKDSALAASSYETAPVLPAHWQQVMGTEFHAMPSSASGQVFLCSNEFSYKRTELNTDSTSGKIEETAVRLRAECEQHRANMTLLKDICDQCGFVFTTDGNISAIEHTEYAIRIPLNGIEQQQSAQLVQAREAFDEHWFEQEAMLGSIERSGIAIDIPSSGVGPIVLRHPSFKGGTREFAPRGYFSNDDFIALQNILDKLIQPQPASTVLPEPASASQAAPGIWRPEPRQRMVIFDCNTLKNLATPRAKEGHSWLDLVKCTARLPHVKVLIPGVVADWELLGKFPIYNADGKRTGFEEKEELQRHLPKLLTAPITQFLASASRGRIMKDGTVFLEPGPNQNVIIMETEEDDAAIYDTIRDILRGLRNTWVPRLQKEIYRLDNGEKAIDRILAALPANVGASIISDDMKYLRHSAPRATGSGMPVGHASTVHYLNAEFSARAPALRADLAEREALTVARLSKSMRSHWKSSHSLHPYCTAGIADAFLGVQAQPETIYDLIQQEVAQLSGHTEVSLPSAVGRRWSESARRKPVTQAPVDPASVRDRRSDLPGAGPTP